MEKNIVVYIFITHSIVNVGGAQSYCINKAAYLEKTGCKVIIISSMEGEILCPDLQKHRLGIFPKIKISPYLFPKTRAKKIVSDITEYIRKKTANDSDIRIESHMVHLAMWAEMIATELKSKHLYMDITEGYTNLSNIQKDYIMYKKSKNALYNNGNKGFDSLKQTEDDESFCPVFAPFVYVGPVDAPLPERFANLHNGVDYLLGSIGRLEKPFVRSMLQSTVKYIKEDREHSYRFVFIGDTGLTDAKNKLIDYLNENGIDFVITGFMYPIPKKMIEQFDLFLSSSGATYNSAECMVPTILYSAQNLQPLGFTGSVKVSMYSDGDDKLFSSLVDIALHHREDAIFKENSPRPIEYYEKIFHSQLLYFDGTDISQGYEILLPLSKKEQIYKVINSVFGYEVAKKCMELYIKLRTR